MRKVGKMLVLGFIFIGFCICPKYIVKTASARVPIPSTQTQYNISASSNWQDYSNTSDSYIEAKNSKYSRFRNSREKNKSQPKQNKNYWDYSTDDPMYWKLKAEYAKHKLRVCQTSSLKGLQDNAARWARLYKACVRNYRRLSEKQRQNNSSDSQKEEASKKTTPPDRRIIPPNPVKMEPPVDAVKKGLADMLDVEPENIEVVSSEQVWWPNTALGFGEPDKMYADVMIPGYKMILKTGDKEYEVHTGRGWAKVKIDDKVHTFPIANTTGFNPSLPIIYPEDNNSNMSSYQDRETQENNNNQEENFISERQSSFKKSLLKKYYSGEISHLQRLLSYWASWANKLNRPVSSSLPGYVQEGRNKVAQRMKEFFEVFEVRINTLEEFFGIDDGQEKIDLSQDNSVEQLSNYINSLLKRLARLENELNRSTSVE